MGPVSSLAALPAWHQWASALAYVLLGLLLLYAVSQYAFRADGSAISRLIHGRTLRGNLNIGLSLVGSLPVLALGIMLAERSADARLERISGRMLETSHAVRAAVEQFIDKHVAGITSAASVISSANRFDEQQMTQWLLVYHSVYDDFLTMLHADANADIVAATSNMTGFLGAIADLQAHNVSDREYFRSPMSDGLPFVSKVFQGRNLGRDPIVAVSAPLRDDTGRSVGIIEGSLDLRAFESLDNNSAGLNGAALILTDQDGRVIYSSESAGLEPLVNYADDPLLQSGSEAGPGSVYSYRASAEPDAARYLAVAAKTSNGWTVNLRMPLNMLYAQIAADYRAATLLALAAWLLSLLIARSFVRRVSGSIDDMNLAIDELRIETDAASIRAPKNSYAEFRPIFKHLRRRAKELRSSYRRLSNSIAAGNRLRSELNQAIARKEVEIAQRTADLQQANQRLSGLSNIDALTGIANRRQFEAFTKRAWQVASHKETPTSIVLLDIDCFKIFNDEQGHQAGDTCLRDVALALSECATRPLDLVARYGGEEFVAVLGDTTIDNALIVAARMRKVVAGLQIPHPGSEYDIVTISCGVAVANSAAGKTLEDTLREADEALYQAKGAGRNCVVHQGSGEFQTFRDTAVQLDATSVLSIISAKRS